jgi:methylenetetrahydrofolate reductase (NADPH)
MKIIDIVKNNEITVSCEMFPPKAGTALTEVKAVVEEIAKLSPAYMSVTYGAGGGTRKTTVDVVDEIQNVIIYPEFLKTEIWHLDGPMKHFVSQG